jgi:predicted PurR-regulated permease PerM
MAPGAESVGTVRPKTLIILASLVATLVVVYLLRGALWPFLAGMVIAYLLDPIADWLERRGAPRGVAAFGIVATFLIFLILALALLLPVLVAQVAALISRLPEYFETFRAFANPLIIEIEDRIGDQMAERLRQTFADFSEESFAAVGGVLRGMLSGGLALVNLLSIAVIMPVVAFYLLRDWDRIVESVDDLLPRTIAPTVREQIGEIDARLSGFIRGQSLVCLVLAIWYAVGLRIVGLEFGLVVGFGAGLISFIPYVGTVVGLGTGLGLAFAQFTDVLPIVGVAIVFATGQALQDFFLVPKLVGERVGLHPAWVLFALMAGGTVLGFTGILLAVPAAAAIGVLVRFGVERYKASPLYHDGELVEMADPVASTGDDDAAAGS